MRKKTNFLDKLKMFWIWVTEKKDGALIVCANCKSPAIEIDSTYVENNNYYSTCKCRKCGATCSSVETWSKS